MVIRNSKRHAEFISASHRTRKSPFDTPPNAQGAPLLRTFTEAAA
ncbi:MAG: hypothetical protein Q8P34_16290 [Bacteroidota bacterium]|nr:hypothetical protein [Bacteroidota bacterium]